MHRPLILVLLFALLTAVRVTAPTDFLEGDQEKQVGYVMNILHQGDWLVQYEIDGEVATKPPFYNWCAALLSRLFGTEAEWVMKLPSLLAGIGLLVCIYLLGCRFFDETAAFYACLACIASHHFSKLFWFARTDMLMAFSVHLAIVLLVYLKRGWRKSLLIGLVLAASALTKGPVGPTLFCLFLLVWGWREGTLRDPAAYRHLIPGAGLFLLLVGAWLAAVWQMPSFAERVVKWQLGTRMVEGRYMDPVYYYVGHVFTRIAPWTFIAAFAVLRGRGRADWPPLRFVGTWALLFFAFFSAVPFKRHDLLLPVYPAIFLLAGVGVRDLLQPSMDKVARGLMLATLGLFAVSAIATARIGEPLAWAVGFGLIASGVAAGILLCRRHPGVMVGIAAGLILIHGGYHHWKYPQGRGRYADLERFTEQVAEITRAPDDVLVYRVNPLIAYELGQHQFLVTPEDLVRHGGQWLIAPPELEGEIEQATRWELQPELPLSLAPRKERAALFRVGLRQTIGSRL